MSQRLTITHPTLFDPSTGEPLRALDIIRGRAVWPILGGAEETETTDDETTDDTGTDDQETETETETDDKGTETVSKSDLDKVTERMKAADRRASAAEAKVKEYEKAGQTETEKLQSERDEAKADREKTAEALKSTRIENAILSLKNAPTWHDPEEAVAILRRSYMEGVEIDDNGKVTGIAEAVKKMAKEKAYLVKTDTTSTSTTDTMNGQRKGDKGDKAAKTAELKSRFPHLANKG